MDATSFEMSFSFFPLITDIISRMMGSVVWADLRSLIDKVIRDGDRDNESSITRNLPGRCLMVKRNWIRYILHLIIIAFVSFLGSRIVRSDS